MSTVLLKDTDTVRFRNRQRRTLCGDCGQLSHDNQATCSRCNGNALQQVSRIGEVYSHTTVQQGAESFVLGLVELADGKLVTARIVDADRDIRIGLAVELVSGRSLQSEPGGLFFTPLRAA